MAFGDVMKMGGVADEMKAAVVVAAAASLVQKRTTAVTCIDAVANVERDRMTRAMRIAIEAGIALIREGIEVEALIDEPVIIEAEMRILLEAIGVVGTGPIVEVIPKIELRALVVFRTSCYVFKILLQLKYRLALLVRSSTMITGNCSELKVNP